MNHAVSNPPDPMSRQRTLKPRSAALAGLIALLTAGLSATVWQLRACRDLAEFGRARPGMPFPFIAVRPGASSAALLASQLVLVLSALGVYDIVVNLTPSTPVEWLSLLSALLGLIPIWIVAHRMGRRMRAAELLAGSDPDSTVKWRWLCVFILIPPLYVANLQRRLNRMWRQVST